MIVRYIPGFNIAAPRDERNREPNRPATLADLRETDGYTNYQILKMLKISLKERES